MCSWFSKYFLLSIFLSISLLPVGSSDEVVPDNRPLPAILEASHAECLQILNEARRLGWPKVEEWMLNYSKVLAFMQNMQFLRIKKGEQLLRLQGEAEALVQMIGLIDEQLRGLGEAELIRRDEFVIFREQQLLAHLQVGSRLKAVYDHIKQIDQCLGQYSDLVDVSQGFLDCAQWRRCANASAYSLVEENRKTQLLVRKRSSRPLKSAVWVLARCTAYENNQYCSVGFFRLAGCDQEVAVEEFLLTNVGLVFAKIVIKRQTCVVAVDLPIEVLSNFVAIYNALIVNSKRMALAVGRHDDGGGVLRAKRSRPGTKASFSGSQERILAPLSKIYPAQTLVRKLVPWVTPDPIAVDLVVEALAKQLSESFKETGFWVPDSGLIKSLKVIAVDLVGRLALRVTGSSEDDGVDQDDILSRYMVLKDCQDSLWSDFKAYQALGITERNLDDVAMVLAQYHWFFELEQACKASLVLKQVFEGRDEGFDFA